MMQYSGTQCFTQSRATQCSPAPRAVCSHRHRAAVNDLAAVFCSLRSCVTVLSAEFWRLEGCWEDSNSGLDLDRSLRAATGSLVHSFARARASNVLRFRGLESVQTDLTVKCVAVTKELMPAAPQKDSRALDKMGAGEAERPSSLSPPKGHQDSLTIYRDQRHGTAMTTESSVHGHVTRDRIRWVKFRPGRS